MTNHTMSEHSIMVLCLAPGFAPRVQVAGIYQGTFLLRNALQFASQISKIPSHNLILIANQFLFTPQL